MSLMLTGYSEYGCQEFIFPEKDNADHSVFLDRSFFGIPEDVELLFDVMDGQWRFQGTSDNAAIGLNSSRVGEAIKAGDMIDICMDWIHAYCNSCDGIYSRCRWITEIFSQFAMPDHNWQRSRQSNHM